MEQVVLARTGAFFLVKRGASYFTLFRVGGAERGIVEFSDAASAREDYARRRTTPPPESRPAPGREQAVQRDYCGQKRGKSKRSRAGKKSDPSLAALIEMVQRDLSRPDPASNGAILPGAPGSPGGSILHVRHRDDAPHGERKPPESRQRPGPKKKGSSAQKRSGT